MTDPFLKYLGVIATADAYRLLALTPGQTNHTAIKRALESQIARVNGHPDANTSEAQLVRTQLEQAAAVIIAGTSVLPEISTQTTPTPLTPPALTVSPVSRTVQPKEVQFSNGPTYQNVTSRLALTHFDRQVLAILVAYGGWNTNSRAKLVAMSSMHQVSPQGLMKVVGGLGKLAASGGIHVDVAQITEGAHRFANLPPAPQMLVEQSRQEDAVAAILPELKHGGTWATIKLSILFGAITILLGFLLFRMMVMPHTSQRTAIQNPIKNQTPTGSSPSVTDNQSNESILKPAVTRFPENPTFLGDASPDDATDAVDQSPRLPELFDELGRKFTVVRITGDAHYNDWNIFNNQAGLCWVLTDQPTYKAIKENFAEVVYAAADRPSLIERLLDDLSALAREVDEPLDVWRGAWAVGIMSEIQDRADTPALLREECRNRIRLLIGSSDVLAHPGFNNAATTWLNARIPRMVNRIELDADIYDYWELWFTVIHKVTDDEEYNNILLNAVESILLTSVDLAQPGKHLNILGRILNMADFTKSQIVMERTLALFGDVRLDSRDLFVLSTLMAQSQAVPWFDDELIISDRAEMDERRFVMRRIEKRWPALNTGSEQIAAGHGIRVDPELADRWNKLAKAQVNQANSRTSPMENRSRVLLEQYVLAAWLNEAASALAAQKNRESSKVLDDVEKGWTALAAKRNNKAAGNSKQNNPVAPVVPGGITTPPGQTRGYDGEWAVAYGEVGVNVQERIRLLSSLRSRAGSDLGSLDAHLFVKEVYHGSPIEVRSLAQSLLIELFKSGPIVAMTMLDLFPDAPANQNNSDIISRLTESILPSFRTASWRYQARQALVIHALKLHPSREDELDRLAKTIADSYLSSASYNRVTGVVNRSVELPADESIKQLVVSLRSVADLLIVSQPVPDTLEGIERSYSTRNLLAEGPIERTVAAQITALELLAYIVAAERPALKEKINTILKECAKKRRHAVNILQQGTITELAMVSLWMLRMNLNEDDDSGSTS